MIFREVNSNNRVKNNKIILSAQRPGSSPGQSHLIMVHSPSSGYKPTELPPTEYDVESVWKKARGLGKNRKNLQLGKGNTGGYWMKLIIPIECETIDMSTEGKIGWLQTLVGRIVLL